MEFTFKTYLAAHRRAEKIAQQACADHMAGFRGPEAWIKWSNTAYLIQLRWARKSGVFWALFT